MVLDGLATNAGMSTAACPLIALNIIDILVTFYIPGVLVISAFPTLQ